MIWTDEAVETLRTLIDQGASASMAGKELGCTRNSAIAKAHREGWNFHSNMCPGSHKISIPRKPRPRRKFVHNSKIADVDPGDQLKELPPDQSPYAIRFMDAREGDCRYPLGNSEPGPDMLICGAPAIVDQPYCKRHCRIAFQGKT